MVVKDYLPSVPTKADRIAQIKAEMMQCPIFEFNGEGAVSTSQNYIEFVIPRAGNRRVRYAYRPSDTAFNEGTQLMQLSTATPNTAYINNVYSGALSNQYISNPMIAPSILKAWSADEERGFFIISSVVAITSLTNNLNGITCHWFTSEANEFYFAWGNGTSSFSLQYIAHDRDAYLSGIGTGETFRCSPNVSHWESIINGTNASFTKDDLSRHDLMLQDCAWARWETSSASSPGLLRDTKLKGKYWFQRKNTTPGITDIFVDAATGKQYLVTAANSLMEL